MIETSPESGPGTPARRDYTEPRVAARSPLQAPQSHANVTGQVAAQPARVNGLAGVHHIVAVASGKGGVGRTVLCANLAVALSRRGLRTGLLDADVNGGQVSRLLGVTQPGGLSAQGLTPALGTSDVRLMSMDLFLPDDFDGQAEPGAAGLPEALAWHGLREENTLAGFLADTQWGDLDILLVDLPPGRDQLGCLLELAPSVSGAVLVALPADAAHRAVRRALADLRQASVRTLGLVLNMAGLACPSCGERLPLWSGEDGAAAAVRFSVPLLGSVPFDPALVRALQSGTVYMQERWEAPAAREVRRIAGAIAEMLEW